MSRSTLQPEHPPKVTDLLIRQKCEAMIEYGYVALRQFPKFERQRPSLIALASALGLTSEQLDGLFIQVASL